MRPLLDEIDRLRAALASVTAERDRMRGVAPRASDDPSTWPLCRTCGKGAREGRHATDLGEGHEYEPA